MESLEGRCLLSASPASPGAGVGTVIWNGQPTVAFRDSYLVEMPTTKVAKPSGFFDYVSTPPAVASGWSIQSIGLGCYGLLTPGASTQEVSAWAASVGALSIEPNQVLVKQSTFPVPNDQAYIPYQWGLNNTGTPPGTISVESAAAARLGNGPDIYPRRLDADIDAPEAWSIQTGTQQVIVAVFDDGIDDTNQDLNRNMWSRDRANAALPADRQIPAAKDNPATGVDQHGFNSAEWLVDSNFYEGSPVAPYSNPSFISTRPGDLSLRQTKEVWVEDTANLGRYVKRQYVSWPGANNSHGTHVAGIIGAGGNNGIGVTGVNWSVSLYSANIFRYGDYDPDGYWRAADQTGSMAAFVDAVNRIKILKEDYDQNFVVANFSFNTYSPSALMRRALQVLNDLNMLMVVAAGNGYDPRRDGGDTYRDGVGDEIGLEPWPRNDCWTYPAGYRRDFPNTMIVVTASSAIDTLPRFANWGPNVDIAAPGENIWSTIPLAARQYQPGLQGLRGGIGTEIPTQYDSFEPFYLTPLDPYHPQPPSAGGVTFTEICPFVGPRDPNPDDPLDAQYWPRWPDSYTELDDPGVPQIISRPLMYREVPREMQEAPLGSKAAEAYAAMSGTSMSTAYVSGVAALVAAEFYRWTNAFPSAVYLKQAIITQADAVATLTYQEGTSFPPDDFQHVVVVSPPAPAAPVRVPVPRTGMYDVRQDQDTDLDRPLHFIRSTSFTGVNGATIPARRDLRVNAFRSVDWVRFNLPASVSFIARPETAEDRGVSRLEGDIDPTQPTPQYTTLLYTAQFVAGTGVFTSMTLPAIPLRFAAWTENRPAGPYSATGGVDYESISSSTPVVFTIPVQTPPTRFYDIPDLSVRVICDNVPENDESFSVQFQVRPDRAVPNTQSIWVRTRTVGETIIDDDATNAKPAVRLSSTAIAFAPEGNGSVRKPTRTFVEFNLDRVARRTVIVPYQVRQGVRRADAAAGVQAAVEGEDFIGASLTVRIPAGQQRVRVPVYVIGDGKQETVEQFQVVLGTPNFGVKKRGTSIAFATITDDDVVVPPPPSGVPVLSIAQGISVTEGSPAVFGLTLSSAVPAGGRIEVAYSVLDGTAKGGQDFIVPPAPRTVTIPAGSTTGAITVKTSTDRFIEPSEAFSVQILRATLTNADGSTELVPITGSSASTATITDANTPPAAPNVALTGVDTTVAEGNSATFRVILQGGDGTYVVPAGYAVAVYYTVLSGTATLGTDMAGPASKSIVIPAGAGIGTINVATLVDRLVEGDERFSVQLTRAVLYRVGSTTTQALKVQTAPISATITDATAQALDAAVASPLIG